jgi:hypothetical protein
MNLSQPTGVSMDGNRSVAIFKGRYKYVYGVDGGGRGFRWDGSSTGVEPIGLRAPTASLTLASTTATTNIVAAVRVVTPGNLYYSPPAVLFRGGGLTNGDPKHAKGLARIRDDGVYDIVVTSAGKGYTSTPTIELSGGRASGASIGVTVSGSLSEVLVTHQGSGYTNGATVGFSGVTGALAEVFISDGKVSDIRILSAGTGATTNATATIYAVSGGTSAQAACLMNFAVTGLTATSGGTNYSGRVDVRFDSLNGFGAAAYLTANTTGALASPVILQRGAYSVPPTADVTGTTAQAVAFLRTPMKGPYRCAIRYVDDTPIAEGGPIPSDISDLVTIDAGAGAQALTWTWANDTADARAAAVELWRSSAHQALVLYRVALLQRVDGDLPTTYEDTLSEAELISPTRNGYALLPITLPSGQLNARRFGVPPSNFEAACWFQDRAWYGADTGGTKPNTLMFSEIDEPESVPSVNELVLQENTGDQDKIVALIPFGSMLVIAQARHLYRLMYVSQPVIDASITLMGYRGLLNKRCWSSFEGAVFCVDSFGMYAFDGGDMKPLSAPVDDYWRDGIIDFSKSARFFVQADPVSRVVRFHYCKSGDDAIPPRALCYSLATQAWWEEVYGTGVGSAAVIGIGGQQRLIVGTQEGTVLKANSGLTDAVSGGTTAIDYMFRTGPLTLADEPSRQVGVLYRPTEAAADLVVNLHYNNATAPRPNAVSSDRGEGVVAGTSGATIDLRKARSALGDATGHATVRYAGRFSDQSAGGDRHLAVRLSGSQQAAAVSVYGLTIGGVTT